ncbi:MAG: MBOAT family protein [Clostridia bacterium]|nr:MBOAT family protein [Clostridia bacterium]
MLFSSFAFLFWFLPITLLLYFLPLLFKRSGTRTLLWQNVLLFAASLLFYAWGEPVYLFLMIATVLLNTALAAAIPHARHPRFPLFAAILLDVLLLIFFKYLPLLGLPAPRLPLGISFYTFQALSYVADVYRGHAKAEKNPFYVGLYIALFPQLIAGPIVRYTDVAVALHKREHSLQNAAYGVRRFAMGLAKKLLLANPMGALFAAYTATTEGGAVGAWLALVGFAFQIYFDFSGYSDMAIGLGRLFGFAFPENFNYPYVATSVSDFWRRWHITLSSFFREYVYFPLGGSRRTSAVTVRNLLIVWLLTGLWHGAAWSFVLWGFYYFVLLSLEKFVLRDILTRLPTFLKILLTNLATLGGWLLFAFDGGSRALSLSALPRFVARLFGAGGLWRGAELYDLLRSLPLLLICALAATPLPKMLFTRLTDQKNAAFLKTALPLFLLLLSVAALADAGYNPFLYFRF